MEKSYSIKHNAMNRWMYGRKIDPLIVADRLHLRVSVFKRMLKEKTPLDEEHIRRLVYFMGAKSAFDVIYFPTLKEREQVREKVFGKAKRKTEGGTK